MIAAGWAIVALLTVLAVLVVWAVVDLLADLARSFRKEPEQ